MAVFEFTEEDIARNKLVKASWYPVIITKVETKPSAGDQSSNTFVTTKGLAGDALHVEVSTCFNEKANAFSGIFDFIKALQGSQPIKGEKYQVDQSLEGKQLEAFIAPGDVKGVIKNVCKMWRPLQQETATA